MRAPASLSLFPLLLVWGARPRAPTPASLHEALFFPGVGSSAACASITAVFSLSAFRGRGRPRHTGGWPTLSLRALDLLVASLLLHCSPNRRGYEL
jgi:hypothetical protein